MSILSPHSSASTALNLLGKLLKKRVERVNFVSILNVCGVDKIFNLYHATPRIKFLAAGIIILL